MDNVQETGIWREYRDALDYQHEMGFDAKFPEFERFKQGDQWPPATERTKNLPRPVFNIVKFFIRSKRANVLNQTVKMVFSPTEVRTGNALPGRMDAAGEFDHAARGAKDYTDYSAALWADIDQDALNEDLVDDAATNGTGILHYYWDDDVNGGMSMKYRGGLRGEVIDALNIFFGNPQERRVQRQPWIIISSRESVEAVRRLAKANGARPEELELIEPDEDTREEGYDAAQKELNSAKKVTVLTKYFRRNGEVFYSKATRSVDIVQGISLTPDTWTDGGIPDPAQASEPDAPKPAARESVRITLYPVVVFDWEKRKKSIFGTGEVESIIPNQKAINFNIGMMLLSVQQTAWPKIVAKPDALRDDITNEPGEVVMDYSSGGWGIQYLQPPNFSGIAVGITDKVFELSRTTEGVNEVSSGEPFTANMAASAIIALQNQAKQPIENIQKRFYRAVREAGKIWEQFFKTYYSLPRNMTVEDADGNEQTRVFHGAAYTDVEFKLQVDVGAGSAYSEALAQSILDKLYDRQAVSTEQYVELLPANILPCKEQLKKMLIQQAMPPDAAQEGGMSDAVPTMQGGNAVGAGQLRAAGPAMPQPPMRQF